ncbi:hypothetical protein NQ317_008613 [Molorchus minor]|uniref:Uncharacterized protein n=1 Tax=Molorchus minor TaxID=1323400 RepID=A0ABQ9ISA5_9CUCU|nr:hypothetical protein NQ317_008613 [Molorchus minor]
MVNGIFEEKNILREEDNVEIMSCYRIGNVKAGSKKPRPIMLKFMSSYHRNIVFYNKKNLKGSKLTVSEDLTNTRYKLLLKTKDKIGKDNVWSQDGNIHIKYNGQKYVIKTEMELEEFIGRQDM